MHRKVGLTFSRSKLFKRAYSSSHEMPCQRHPRKNPLGTHISTPLMEGSLCCMHYNVSRDRGIKFLNVFRNTHAHPHSFEHFFFLELPCFFLFASAICVRRKISFSTGDVPEAENTVIVVCRTLWSRLPCTHTDKARNLGTICLLNIFFFYFLHLVMTCDSFTFYFATIFVQE